MKILITGGGSGGHVSPALAVAKVLQAQSDMELLYVGGTLTMEGSTGPSVEQSLVQPTDIPFVAISAGKLKRDGLSLTTVTRLWGVVPGIFQAFKVVKDFKPQVVLSTGGYVSLPVVWAAWMQGIPVVIHEQTAAVGLANQIASRMANVIAITFPQSATYFNAKKVVLTGNPLNQQVANPTSDGLKSDPVLGWLQRKSAKPLIYVTGGGLGSHVINLAVEQDLEKLLTVYRVIHQTGSNQKFADYERLTELQKRLPSKLAQDYLPLQQLAVSQIGHIYKAASLVVCRAGANTILELAYWGLPAICIPIPWVTHDEQTKNAQALVEAGTATIVKESLLSDRVLFDTIEQQLAHPPTQQQKDAAKQLVKLDADQVLASITVSLAQARSVS